MINPVSPQFVYLIHQEKIRELELEIEMKNKARVMRAYEAGDARAQKPAWYAQASGWMQEKLFKRASSHPEMFEEPCPVTPC